MGNRKVIVKNAPVVVTSSRTRSTTVAARPGEAVTAIEAREEDTEVMAVDGDLVTKLKVAYRTFSSVETTGGVARDLPTPTAGQEELADI